MPFCMTYSGAASGDRARHHTESQPTMRILPSVALFSTLCLLTQAAPAADARRVDFGSLDDGTRIEAVEFSNGNGMRARIMTLGATVQSLSVPDRDGNSGDIVLGYATPAEYLARPQYFGASVGRYANRIAHGRFTLDGHEYTLETNDGPNHLHGGLHGLDKVVWKLESVQGGSPARAVFTYSSPDGAGGYPGKLDVRAICSLGDDNVLTVEYQAQTDKPTIVNITNHSYFNLAGEDGTSDVMAQRLTIDADQYTPVDSTLIPTGELRDVAGTPFDFREAHEIGLRIRDGHDQQIRYGRGYDHNFVLNDSDGSLRRAVVVEDPGSGRVMELWTTAPGVQFYSGNFLDATTTGKSGRVYRQGDALCLEPQVFPDSPNHPDFPSARLDPGHIYKNKMEYRFSTEAE
jgi:aldose 1-epimerase